MHTLSLLRGAALSGVCALGFAANASAEEFQRELWVTSGFLSHHTQHASRYNQHNDGLGLEWRWAQDFQLNTGHYRNSLRHGSTYAQLGWTPLDHQLSPSLKWQAGASVGVINGYPKVRHGGYFATLVPAMTLEWGRVGVNLLYIPSVGKRVDGAYAVQLKFKVR